MKKNEGGLRENIKRAFSAFAYEHSGEMLSTYRKYQVLSDGAMDAAADAAAKDDYPAAVDKTAGFKRFRLAWVGIK